MHRAWRFLRENALWLLLPWVLLLLALLAVAALGALGGWLPEMYR
jgi:hypothetical protein